MRIHLVHLNRSLLSTSAYDLTVENIDHYKWYRPDAAYFCKVASSPNLIQQPMVGSGVLAIKVNHCGTSLKLSTKNWDQCRVISTTAVTPPTRSWTNTQFPNRISFRPVGKLKMHERSHNPMPAGCGVFLANICFPKALSASLFVEKESKRILRKNTELNEKISDQRPHEKWRMISRWPN